jgi:hypothetical protein
MEILQEFLHNFTHNLFKPLLLFFYAGFLIPILGVKFEFPKVLYQGLTIFLLIAIGWHGGEELAKLPPSMYGQAAGFMVLGFVINAVIGFIAYGMLRMGTNLRRVDAATVAGYYGSDSAGTFVTCQGVLLAAKIAAAAYMPVMLAIMEMPGCLVALFLISKLRQAGMDAEGNMPDEAGYRRPLLRGPARRSNPHGDGDETTVTQGEEQLVGAGTVAKSASSGSTQPAAVARHGGPDHGDPSAEIKAREAALAAEDQIALQTVEEDEVPKHGKQGSVFSPELLHEVFLNPGVYLLFAGIVIGVVSTLQGEQVIKPNDRFFGEMFQGLLCLFLLEMGMTASRKLKDLRRGGWRFIAFGLLAPNLFATFGMLAAYGYSLATGAPLELGTYVLFAVLCGASSYIAMPAVQRMAIPEASPTLPLAASLGLTFSYNVTIGIPFYMMIAKYLFGAL